MKCNICPRECGADRENGQLGVCGVDNKIYIARAALHMWEEPCISGKEGSGAVFFKGCPLGCIYCQNSKISNGLRTTSDARSIGEKSRAYSVLELADIFLRLQEEGANNINLVTPTHYSFHIIEALDMAKEKGLSIPIVYNCSGYEKIETLKSLNGYIDIYLTDFKYMNEELALNYSKAQNYVEVAKLALEEMVKQCAQFEFDEREMMRRGVIVRNLLLPGNVNNSKDVVKYVADNYGNKVYISLMSQYTPMERVGGIESLNRKTTKREYNRLVDYAISLGLTNVFVQYGDVAKESFIPDFE